MNGIRSKPETSPPSQIAGQPQSRNLGFHYTGEEFQPGNYQSNFPPTSQYSVQPLGPSGSYELGKPGFSAPRMPSPGLGQQQQQAMYQQQPQPGVRQNAPFYQTGQQNMNIRHPRFPGANQSNIQYVQHPFVMYSNPNMGGQQQLIMNQNMMPPQRMPNPQYNQGMQANQAGIHYPVPQANIPYSSPGYGNQPLFLPSQVTPNQRPPSAPASAPPKHTKTILKIEDPNTGKDLTEEILRIPHSTAESSSADSRSRSTPLPNTEPAPPANAKPQGEIAAIFAAQVAARLSTTGSAPTNPSPPQNQTAPMGGGLPPTMGGGGEPPMVQSMPPQFTQPPQSDTVTYSQPPLQKAAPEYPTNTADGGVTQSQSLSNGATSVASEASKPSDGDVPGKISESANINKTQATSESVTVSVKTSPYVERTNISDNDNIDKSSSSREKTPEVNIVPPTPVEKEPETQIPTKTVEPATEFVTVPKKQKAKNKYKELNKKAEQKVGSEFDAYTDTCVPEETPEVTTTKPAETVKENTVQKTEQKKQEPTKTTTEQPKTVEPPVPAVEKKEAEPIKEAPAVVDTVSPTQTTNETVPVVEIQIEESEDVGDELEDGEIEDDSDDGMDELRYKYSEDQWSPLNPEGKKHYDREFLLQFQNDSNAVRKPVGLPDIPDIILDKPQSAGRQFSRDNISVGGPGSDFDFTPKYVWSNTPGGGGGSKSRGGIPRQPSNQKNKSGPPPRHINLSISKDIELHKAKEAWKPTHTDKKEKDPKEGEEDTEELYKKTRSILNKLTPQKFQTLVSQMQALPIDSEVKLKGVIDLVFEKAISEPSFSVAYANMCRCLSMCKVQSATKPGEFVNFRAVLLTRCQREFEKDKSSEARFTEMRVELDKAEDSKKAELKQELEYEESKAKRRSLGNIRFIGELFKLKMLTDNIMHDCVFKLLRSKDAENLECLCRLLTTIGKELDTDKARPRIDQYFQQMNKIVNEKKTSSRVRFMLRDVIDLRLSKWVPRRVDNNPKTIDQIHKEVQQEAQEKALLSQQNQQQQRQNRGGGGGGGGGRRPPNVNDGWNTVGGQRTPLKSVDRSIDPSKMKLSKQNVDESNIQLGPGGGASRFAGWGRGSTGGTSGRPSQEKEKQPNTPANRFSALSRPDEGEQGRRYQGVSPARSDSRGRGGFMRPPSVGTRHSQEYERERAGAVAAAKAIGTSQSVEGGHRERSRGRAEPESRPPPASKPDVKALSVDEMEKKSKAILDEYFAILDTKEALLCVQELSVDNHFQFVSNAMNHVLERSSQARKQTGHLLHDLVNKQILSVDNYIKGLLEVLEYAEDLEIDIPKIWQYYGELISPMIQDNSVPLSFLKQAAQPLIANNKAGNLLAEVLHDASHREGHKKVSQLWASSGLHWSDFVPKNQVEQFLKDKGLEFTNGGDSAPTTPTTGLPLKEIEEKLKELMVQKKSDNETVFDWIESNVDEPTTKTKKFIRALMTAVCKSAIKGDKGKEKLDPKEISIRNDLLQKYLDHQAESELQALYAVQALITQLEHPSGVLRGMFDTLYDEDIISEDAFFQWEKSEDEIDGKGACLKQAVQFFTWLREAEDDS